MEAVDEAGGEEGRVEARAGFSEQGEDAFFAELVEELCRAGRGLLPQARTSTRTPRLAQFADARLVVGDGEDDDVVLRGGDQFAIERHAQGGVEDDAQQRAAAAQAAAVGHPGIVGEHGVDADHGGVGVPAEGLHGGAGELRW